MSHKSRVLCDRATDHILLSTIISGMVASPLDVLTLVLSFSSHVTLTSTDTGSHAPSLIWFVHLLSFPPPCPTPLTVSAPLSPPTHVQSHGSNSIVVRHPLFSVSSLQPADHTQISDMHLQNTSTHRQSYRRFRTILVAHRPPTAAGCSCSRRRSIYC